MDIDGHGEPDETVLTKTQLIKVLAILKEKVPKGVYDAALATVIATQRGDNGRNGGGKRKREQQQAKKKPPRPFDMSKFRQRQIVIKFLYFGEKYDGLAAQENTQETIEHYLYEALIKTRMIVDRDSCLSSRCGRTDKGVSALCQVICLRVRSSLPTTMSAAEVEAIGAGDSVQVDRIKHKGVKELSEIDYCGILNRALPDEIRMISWAPAPPPTSGFETFSARFNADMRTYRYFFVRRDLDIAAMQRGADFLLGTHDFRNFCKMDPVSRI
jgi:tRNA pseudouridine38/39 synthase